MGGVEMARVPTGGEPTADEASRGRISRWSPSPDAAINTGSPGSIATDVTATPVSGRAATGAETEGAAA
ncbi:hypothetical protein NE857_01920 [Nocardiopsis exhalans]|uniref:Uncharacterized protein n=1 Tax=Nocardiopsis exhalans TaxID=163604 RepID=A0ABY5DBJ6_9ACTN|nr:hypothetical protein [Nocardiopsis exhalans]USY20443.1 hypothetical protein NE857_01920 [Nocardiopsis exhalans]